MVPNNHNRKGQAEEIIHLLFVIQVKLDGVHKNATASRRTPWSHPFCAFRHLRPQGICILIDGKERPKIEDKT